MPVADIMRGMEKLGRKKQISYPSTPEIVAGLDLAAAKVATMTTVGGSKLRTGHLVNAIALWLDTLTDDELRDFAVPKIRLLEKHLGRDGDSVPPVAAAEDLPRGTPNLVVESDASLDKVRLPKRGNKRS